MEWEVLEQPSSQMVNRLLVQLALQSGEMRKMVQMLAEGQIAGRANTAQTRSKMLSVFLYVCVCVCVCVWVCVCVCAYTAGRLSNIIPFLLKTNNCRPITGL